MPLQRITDFFRACPKVRAFTTDLLDVGINVVAMKLPSNRSACIVAWRARRIGDPVQKLRYLRRAAHLAPARSGRRHRSHAWRAAAFGMVLVLLAVRSASDATVHRSTQPVLPSPSAPAGAIREVWLVESQKGYEIYSNGLRVENRFAIANRVRSFVAFDRRVPGTPPGMTGTDPAGIVFHTTESHSAPFEPGQNRALKRAGEALLEFVRDKRSYHFVIDRFGRVHRVVLESDAANHAGYSVWADEKWIYLNLNSSFLGVSFEGETEHAHDRITPAQIHAGKILTEMLRSKYHLGAGNCVTHAQVSVNPDNLHLGYHTDWAGNFPFEEIGLGNNYAQAIPGLYLFGFEYDPVFVNATGAPLWKGLALAEERLREEATVEGLTVAEYKRILRKRYREKLAAVESKGETS
jgi:hypothetical protein